MPNAQHHSFRWNVLTVAATIAIVVAFILAAQATSNKRHEDNRLAVILHQADYNACQRINKISKIIQDQVRLSIQSIPKLTYYKTHPAELRAQLLTLHREVEAFAPESCKGGR